MRVGRPHLMLAAFATAIAGCSDPGSRPAAPTSAAALSPLAVMDATAEPRLAVVRVRIDPAVGDSEAQIRRLLGAYPFVRIGEPADYLVTTNRDLPLDLELIDLGARPEFFDRTAKERLQLGDPPPTFAIGNLTEATTTERLGAMLTAASRIKAITERSAADLQGVEACVLITADVSDPEGERPPDCVPLADLGDRMLLSDWASSIRIRNGSDGDRHIAIAASGDDLRFGGLGEPDIVRVGKLAPGRSIEFKTVLAAHHYGLDPRIFLVVSSRPFSVDDWPQHAPLDPGGECGNSPAAETCRPGPSGIAISDDIAVQSVRLHFLEEPQPAMGNAADATARMAVWMAQFYSVIPYTQAEIEADSKLGDDQTQFLKLRSREERQHRCGGALIAPSLVLTAAHCVAKGQYAGAGLAKMMKDRRVRLGSLRLGEGGQTYAIAGVAVHPGYDPDTVKHDIAILLLAADRGTVPAREPIRPVAVAQRPLPGGVAATAFGYGLTGAVTPSGNMMMTVDLRVQQNKEVLQYGEMHSVSLAECKRKLANEVAAGMVCMYSKEALSGGQSGEGVFTCRGDSGGPLVRDIGGRDTLVGVVSWSKGCGYKTYPSVFTDAGAYSAWIAAASTALKPGLTIRPRDPARPTLGASQNPN